MVGKWNRYTSSVTATPSTVTSSSAAFGRWAFGIGQPRRDRRGRTGIVKGRSVRSAANVLTTWSCSASGIFAICCDLTRPTITRLARIFQSTRTRRRREQYIPLVAFCRRHFLADFIICMCEFDFRQAQVADIDDEASEIVLLTHWIGGVHTELRLPRRRRGQRNSISADMLAAVRQLVLIANDDLIAGILNRSGLVTGHGNRWTRERVSALRSHHKIPAFRPAPDGNEPWLNLNKAAGLLGIAPKTLRLAAEAGEIEGGHPLPDGPWIFSRSTLGEPAAQRVVHRARQNPNHPTGSHPDQQNLFSPIT